MASLLLGGESTEGLHRIFTIDDDDDDDDYADDADDADDEGIHLFML